MHRTVFDDDHESFRKTLRAFLEAEVLPHYDAWFSAGVVPKELYLKLGELGLFGISVAEEYGGAGLATHKFTAIEYEEIARVGVLLGGSSAHVLLALPYVQMLATTSRRPATCPASSPARRCGRSP